MLFCTSAFGAEELKLPNLGENSTSLFSPEQEYQLGRAWLRMFRSQVPTLDDPLIHDYLENLLYNLATHSELQDRRIELVVVENPVLNAFAVPGGVVGVHTGLMLYAQSEDELATVLAHEIAHLSQRHFSRGVEQQKKQQPLSLAGMLAGLVLIATTGSSAGMAALSASQAAAIESQLRFSRANEQEADRIGMQTMAEAGMDPHAAPAMFERMLTATRYSSGNRVPEFLRTHPVTTNRIAETRARAAEYEVGEVEEATVLGAGFERVDGLDGLADLLDRRVVTGEVDLFDEVVVVVGVEVLLVLHRERHDAPALGLEQIVLVEHDGFGTAAAVVVAGDGDLRWHVDLSVRGTGA